MTTTTQEFRNAAAAPGVPPKISSRPDGSVVRSNSGVRELTAMGILTALRRRWVPALMLAIPAALLASAIVWVQIPAKYESSAVLKIQQFEQNIAFGNGNRSTEFLTYVDTAKAFIKSRGVLTSALRNPKVAECSTLSKIQHPVEWLMKGLSVDGQVSPEFLKISLQGDVPEDLALIVNAIKDSYLNEVVYNERNKRIETLRKAEQSHRDVDNRVRAAQANIERLAKHLGSVDPKLLIHDQGRIQMRISDLEKKLAEYNDSILAEEALQAQGLSGGLMSIDPNLSRIRSNVPGTATPGTQAPLDYRGRLIQVLQEIDQFERNTRNPNHPDLMAKRKEADQLRSLLGVGTTPSADGTASPAAFSRVTYLTKLRDAISSEIAAQEKLFAEKNLQMLDLEREQREIDPDVKMRESLAQEIREQEVELNAPDRISSVQDANVPEEREIKKKTQPIMYMRK